MPIVLLHAPWRGAEKGASSQTRYLVCPVVFHLPTAGAEWSSGTPQAYPCLEGVLVWTLGKVGCMGQPVLKDGVGFGCEWCLAVDPGERWLLGRVLRSYLCIGKKNLLLIP